MSSPKPLVRTSSRLTVAALLLFGATASALAQERPDPVALMKAQREAMATFAFMDGIWRGPASTVRPDGSRHDITQTERIGPLLDGTVKVIEGRGYEPDGRRTSFNALGIISYNAATQAFSMRAYAMGFAGDYPVKRNADDFSWEIPAGPVTIRYTAVVKDGRWTEVGDRIAPGRVSGHEVGVAFELGWSTLKNGDLLDAAERAGFNVFVTTDARLKYQQNLAVEQSPSFACNRQAGPGYSECWVPSLAPSNRRRRAATSRSRYLSR